MQEGGEEGRVGVGKTNKVVNYSVVCGRKSGRVSKYSQETPSATLPIR